MKNCNSVFSILSFKSGSIHARGKSQLLLEKKHVGRNIKAISRQHLSLHELTVNP